MFKLFLIIILSFSYSNEEGYSCIDIQENYFRDDIVAYYLSAIDVNTGASNIPIFGYSIIPTSPNCYNKNFILEFSLEIFSPTIGLNSYQILFSGEIEIINLSEAGITFSNMDLNYNTRFLSGADEFNLMSYSGPTDIEDGEAELLSSYILNSGKIPNGLYTFTFVLKDENGISETSLIKNIEVSEPQYLHLISPGNSNVSDSSNNTIYTNFPVFTWDSDNCSSCETRIRISEFNKNIHSSLSEAINDVANVPDTNGDEYLTINSNLNSFQYPVSNSKNLLSGKLYVWQLKRIFQSTIGEQEILSDIYLFKVFAPEYRDSNNLDVIKLIIGEEKFNELFLENGLLANYNQLEENIILNGNEISTSQLNEIINQMQNGTFTIQEIIVE